MRFRFKTKRLESLYLHNTGANRYPPETVRAFFRVMAIIQAAADESAFRQLEQLHFEKLQGARGEAGQRSMRLHGRWRLIVSIEVDEQGKVLLVLEISNHYE